MIQITWPVLLFIFSEVPACFSSSALFYYSLTLWHPQVSYWRCASWAWIKWEAYLQTPTSTCCTWCTRPWACVCTCRIGKEPCAMERRSFIHTGWNMCISALAYRHSIYECVFVCVCIIFLIYLFYSFHYPAYSLNVASMYLKLGHLYLGLEKRTQGVKALKKVCVW